jgi:hypothetical protein
MKIITNSNKNYFNEISFNTDSSLPIIMQQLCDYSLIVTLTKLYHILAVIAVYSSDNNEKRPAFASLLLSRINE